MTAAAFAAPRPHAPAAWARAAWVALLAAIALLLAAPGSAQTFPPLTGRVVDAAHLLDAAQTADLDAKLAALETQSGHQMVVATVPSLEGQEIEDYGYKLGRAWGIGQKKGNDGLILLVAPTERKVRIEVGYGLEPIVTDALSSVIVQRQILPHFRDGDMAGGIVAGANALVGLLQLPDDQAQARAQAMVSADKKERKHGGGVPISLIFWLIVIAFVVISNIVGRFGGGRRYRRGGGGPVILWGPGLGGGWGGGSSGGSGWGGGGGGGGFSGGGGSFGGGGSSGSW
jgi:uncharacterized protein